jgi:hypothetical protein
VAKPGLVRRPIAGRGFHSRTQELYYARDQAHAPEPGVAWKNQRHSLCRLTQRIRFTLAAQKQSKRFSLRLFSSSQVLSQKEDKILTSIARRNFAFLKARKWLHHYEIHEQIMIAKDPPQTYYFALIEDTGSWRKPLAHFKIAPGGYVTNSIAKHHALNCESLIDISSAKEALSFLFGSPQRYIQMESIEGRGREFRYPVIRNDLNIAEIIQFCGELPLVLPLLLGAYMIGALPSQLVGSLGLSSHPYLKSIFCKAAFYGTSTVNVSSFIAEAVNIEPIHLGPLLNDLNSQAALPYRVSFWPLYSTCYPWGAIMFAHMIEAVKRRLNIDFANEVEILDPHGEPIFGRGYHQRFCADQLSLALIHENALGKPSQDDSTQLPIATSYRSNVYDQS